MGKSLVIVLSNLSTAMCHAFIKDQELLLPPVNVSDFSKDSKDSKDKQSDHNLHVLSDEEKKTLLKNECGQKWCQSQFTIYKLQLTITRSCKSFDDSRLVDFNS
jgi:hypothetical protein